MRNFLLLLALLPTISSDHISICQNDYTLINNKCWKLFLTPMVHRDAVKTCSSQFGNLVTIKNSIDNRALATFLGATVKHLWIGLYCFQSDTSNCLWDDASGSTSDYSNFASGFPLTDVGGCVYYSVSGALAGQWISDDCEDDMRPFVCEAPSTYQDTCKNNYNGHCYFSSYYFDTNQELGFDSAESACVATFCGHLVSMHSPSEVRYVKSLFQFQTENTFIGAVTITGKYRTWTDGSSWAYDNIDTNNQTSGNCMMMALITSGNLLNQWKYQDSWYPSDCQTSRYYVCKRPIGTPCFGPPTDSPSQNCNRFIMAPGTFTSPGYPGNYTNNLKCAFSLATLGSSRIRLSFNSFNTESPWDKVSIYDGESADARLLDTISGPLVTPGDPPIKYESTRNRMFVVFITNYNVAPGFSANFLQLLY